jgi:hypothetical protein
MIIVLLIFVNIPVYKKIAGLFFKEKASLDKAIHYYIRPSIISLFKGDLDKDIAHEFTLIVVIFLCVVITGGEYVILSLALRLLGIT